jgi:short-subunit dehydrogenase
MARRIIDGCRGVLTGASSGIGRALAIELVRGGAKLLVVARRAERLQALAAHLAGAAGQLHIFVGDVASSESRQAVVAEARRLFGGLDLLVNNAGIGAMGRFADAQPDRLRQVMEVNFFAAAELIRDCLPLLASGNRPIVVNVGSILGHRGVPLCAEYCASKFALQGLSESLRAEFAALGIDLLMVSPGTTDTDFFASAIDASQALPSNRRGVSPEVVAHRTLAAIRSGRHEIVVGASTKLLLWMNRLVPRVVDSLLARYARRRGEPPTG